MDFFSTYQRLNTLTITSATIELFVWLLVKNEIGIHVYSYFIPTGNPNCISRLSWVRMFAIFKSSMQVHYSHFRTFLFVCVNGACLGFVIWQTIKCINSYIEQPIGTMLKMKKSSVLTFPAIAVCGCYSEHNFDYNFEMVYEYSYFYKQDLKKTCDIR